MEFFVEASESWPQDNEAGEDQLRNALVDFGVLTSDGARQLARSLETEHAWRRRTVSQSSTSPRSPLPSSTSLISPS
jgi:hypothetical protein